MFTQPLSGVQRETEQKMCLGTPESGRVNTTPSSLPPGTERVAIMINDFMPIFVKNIKKVIEFIATLLTKSYLSIQDVGLPGSAGADHAPPVLNACILCAMLAENVLSPTGGTPLLDARLRTSATRGGCSVTLSLASM